MKLKLDRTRIVFAMISGLVLTSVFTTVLAPVSNTVPMNHTTTFSSSAVATPDSAPPKTDETGIVVFEPRWNSGSIALRDRNGNRIATLSEMTIFEVVISQDILRTAVTKNGINVTKIVHALPSRKLKNGRIIPVALPFEVRTLKGEILKPGTPVYIDQSTLIKNSRVQLSGARTETNTQDVTNAENFNDNLQNKGVQGEKPLPPEAHPQVPLTTENEVLVETETRILSSPTCGCKKGSCYVTSYFGKRKRERTTNGGRTSRHHPGIDIGGGAGTPIIAAADGCVTRKLVNKRGASGLTVYLDHGNGLVTQYSHMKSFKPNLRLNQCFKRGDTIGFMGQTGNCTGPHLHFGVYKNGEAVDPRRHMLERSNVSLSRSCSSQPEVVTPAEMNLAQSSARAPRTPLKTTAD